MMRLPETRKRHIMKYPKEYWKDRLGGAEVPEDVKTAIRRVYESYPRECMPQGLCDPLYIMNIIALALGVGDGLGTFYHMGGESHND
jgi:hypothetical protein